MDNVLKNIGVQIKERRLELGMSQEDLAGIAEVDRSYLSEIECGHKNLSVLVLLRISEALSVKADVLLKKSI